MAFGQMASFHSCDVETFERRSFRVSLVISLAGCSSLKLSAAAGLQYDQLRINVTTPSPSRRLDLVNCPIWPVSKRLVGWSQTLFEKRISRFAPHISYLFPMILHTLCGIFQLLWRQVFKLRKLRLKFRKTSAHSFHRYAVDDCSFEYGVSKRRDSGRERTTTHGAIHHP